jgi:ribonuclease E
MLENDEPAGTVTEDAAEQATRATDTAPTRRRRAAGRPAGPPSAETTPAEPAAPAPDEAAEKPKAKRTRKKAVPDTPADTPAGTPAGASAESAEEKPKAKRTRKKAAPAPVEPEVAADPEPEAEVEAEAGAEVEAEAGDDTEDGGAPAAVPPTMLLFQAPEPEAAPRRRARRRVAEIAEDLDAIVEDAPEEDIEAVEDALAEVDAESDDDEATGPTRRRRRRGGRGRRGRGGRAGEGSGDDAATDAATDDAAEDGADEAAAEDSSADETGEGGTRRRRRRRRRGEEGDSATDDPENTVVRVRSGRSERARGSSDDEVTSVRGSTRLEAKKQRRREGREAGRRRVPIITEAEFLARREAVERVMVVRQGKERTQIAVLEDGVLVEHYVNKVDSTSLMGNVFLGRVQNVLPSMEAAFVDIGKGRNAVLYAGEVNFEGLEGQPKRIEHALKSGQSVLVQVTKDPIGHKGARLTSQISLPGRYLVYVPEGSMTGISRKLPDTERARLKAILKKVVPEDAGVIIRTAAEGASEEELARDVERLAKQWEAIQKKAKTASAPALLLGEPDLTIRVVRDIFNSDFTSLVVAGDDAWTEVSEYVDSAAPDLRDRVSRWTGEQDVFANYRVDEQILKALDRKVWLPSGGSLVIDRTEAMTVVDVNTGKFTGQGGNLEETVTRNNLEAAEEIVRQLRLRDIGGIIVVDFIDMVLESNRELVLRRLVECLGRDRTKHQVAEVTSLGLVQMTRKKIGQGLLEAFSHSCEHCNGRGIVVRTEQPERAPVIPKPGPPGQRQPLDADAPATGGSRSSRRRRGRGKGGDAGEPAEVAEVVPDEATALEAESTSSDEAPVLASTDVEAEELATTDVDAAGEVVAAGDAPEPVTVTASPDDPDAATDKADAEPEAKPARRRRRATSTGKAPAKEPEPASV